MTAEEAEVVVRWMRTPAIDAPELERWKLLLDASERQRSERYRLPPDRASYVAAHALLRSTLSSFYAVEPNIWKFNRGQGGKPLLDPPTELSFSLSHCRRFVACIVCRNFTVGVDIEDTSRPEKQWRNAEAFLPRVERELLNTASPELRRERFFLLWTLREAFAKASGRGLAFALEQVAFQLEPPRIVVRGHEVDASTDWHFEFWRPAPDCVLSLAIQKNSARIPRMRLHEVAWAQIVSNHGSRPPIEQ